MTMRVPPAGSVPIGFSLFHFTVDPESRLKAGDELKNPYQPTEEIIDRGKLIFTTFCVGCHGATGMGDGQLYSSGLYPLKPRPISQEATAKLRDGRYIIP